MVRSEVSADIIDRFRTHVQQVGDCWIWTGTKLKSGHGVIHANNGNLLVHRIAYVLGHGELRPGVAVRHRCKEQSCVRPEHLHIASTSDAQQPNTRKIPSYVTEIRESYERGFEYWEIAPAYGRVLTPLQVRTIALNKAWTDLDYKPRQQIRRKPDARKKLTTAAIKSMRRHFVHGSPTRGVAALARAHGVSYSIAWEAINGRPSHAKRLNSNGSY
jgi:hypothetical protein